MNLNPIKQKLAKMFGKKKKRQATVISTVNESQTRTISDFNLTCISEINVCNWASDENIDSSFIEYNKQNFNQRQQETDEVCLLRAQLKHFQQKSKKLQQRVKDHELLQQFYLEQLKSRAQVQRQLKWKLDIIRQEITNNRLKSQSFAIINQEQQRLSVCLSQKALSTQY